MDKFSRGKAPLPVAAVLFFLSSIVLSSCAGFLLPDTIRPGYTITNDTLDSKNGFDATLLLTINLVDTSILDKENKSVHFALSVPDDIKRNDPQYKKIKQENSQTLADYYYNAVFSARGDWKRERGKQSFVGAFFGGVKSGDYETGFFQIYWDQRRDEGYTRLPLPAARFNIPPGTLCYLGRITISINPQPDRPGKIEWKYSVQNDSETMQRDLESFKAKNPKLYRQFAVKVMVVKL